MSLPEFDFSTYNPRDPWNFPPQRLVRFAAEASAMLKPHRNHWAIRHPYPDIRFVIFQELQSSIFTIHAMSCMLAEHALSPDWWAAQPSFGKKLPQETLKANFISLRESLLAGLLHQWVSSIDHHFKRILLAITPESEALGSLTPRQATRRLLKATGLYDREPLINLLRILLSSTLSGGKFCPGNRKDLSISYRGRIYHFVNMQPVEGHDQGFIDTWDWVLSLLKELVDLLNQIFESAHLVQIPQLKARYLE